MPLIRFLLRLYNLYLSPERDFARRVRELVGFAPARLSIFRLAFAHKSNQRVDRATGQSASNNNERLEYLGDAVLGTIVAEYLFKKYPDADEGFLTKMRSKIVKRKSLNAVGDEMGLDVFLTELNRVRLSSSMLGNAVEALCGAVYLERGYEGTKRFVIRRMLRPYVDIDTLETTDDNYKSQLLEFCQKNGKSIAYQLIDKFKRDRRDRFRVAVLVGGKKVAEADDFNKKAAEQLASRRALAVLGAIDALPAPAHSEKSSRRSAPPKKSKASEGRTPGTRPAPARPAAVGPEATPAASDDTAPASGAAAPAAIPSAPHPPASPPAPTPARRRSTGISRKLYHATRTASAALVALEGIDGRSIAAPTHSEAVGSIEAPQRAVLQPRRRSALSRTAAEAVHVATAALAATADPAPDNPHTREPRPTVPTAASPTAVPPAPPTKRRRRPVPLRLLTPIVNHAAAALAIEFGLPATPTEQDRRAAGEGDVAAETDDGWDDTPLELVGEAVVPGADAAPPPPPSPSSPSRDRRAASEPAKPTPLRRRRKRDKYDWVVSRDWVDLAPPPSSRER